MSQYFTYVNFPGRKVIDVLTDDSNCKSCSNSECYGKFIDIQGVSNSKIIPFRSEPINDLISSAAYIIPCDDHMLNCMGTDLELSDPYNNSTKTISKCNTSITKYYNPSLPYVDGSLNKNKIESPRYMSNKEHRNSSDFSANINIKPVKLSLSRKTSKAVNHWFDNRYGNKLPISIESPTSVKSSTTKQTKSINSSTPIKSSKLILSNNSSTSTKSSNK